MRHARPASPQWARGPNHWHYTRFNPIISTMRSSSAQSGFPRSLKKSVSATSEEPWMINAPVSSSSRPARIWKTWIQNEQMTATSKLNASNKPVIVSQQLRTNQSAVKPRLKHQLSGARVMRQKWTENDVRSRAETRVDAADAASARRTNERAGERTARCCHSNRQLTNNNQTDTVADNEHPLNATTTASATRRNRQESREE